MRSEQSRDRRSDTRKERVIHARIPASLEAEIKRLADGLRIPVSNLVRNILQDTVAMVDGVQGSVHHAIEGLRSSLGRLESRVVEAGQAPSPPPAAPETEPARKADPAGGRVFGWQEIVLNLEAQCAFCRARLSRGMRALFGMTGRADDRIFICPGCVPRPGELQKESVP